MDRSLAGGESDISSVFSTSTKWFDFIVKIKQCRLAKEKTSEMTKNDKHRIEVADWSPVKMLCQRFDAACGHLAMFFGDEHGGREIGVKLKPEKALSGLQVRPWTIQEW